MGLFSRSRKSLGDGVKAETAGTAPPKGTIGGSIGMTIDGGDLAAGADGARATLADVDADVEPESLEPANDLIMEVEPSDEVGQRRDKRSETTGAAGNAVRSFAMADAIRLLKALPAGPKVEMVVRLVRVTLGAANVAVGELSEELEWKEKVLEGKIGRLRAEADALEKHLQAKRAELGVQQAEAGDLARVRARLQMPMSPAAHRPPPIPPAAIKRAPGTTAAVHSA